MSYPSAIDKPPMGPSEKVSSVTTSPFDEGAVGCREADLRRIATPLGRSNLFSIKPSPPAADAAFELGGHKTRGCSSELKLVGMGGGPRGAVPGFLVAARWAFRWVFTETGLHPKTKAGF
jgi:hypothetical protein